MAAKVIDINDSRPAKVSVVICLKCLKRWVAVRPLATRLIDLECPQCHEQGFAIETGEDINNYK